MSKTLRGQQRGQFALCVFLLLCGWTSARALPLPVVDFAVGQVGTSASVLFGEVYDESNSEFILAPPPYESQSLVSKGNLATTGARALGEASASDMRVNAQFRAGSFLPQGGANGGSEYQFELINNSGFDHEVWLTFRIPPALLEFTDNIESATIPGRNLSAHVQARLCADAILRVFGCSTLGSYQPVPIFDFRAQLREAIAISTSGGIGIGYNLGTSIAESYSSDLYAQLSPLLSPAIDMQLFTDLVPSTTVTASFPSVTGEVHLGVLPTGETRSFVYEMFAQVEGGGVINTAAIAAINDPLLIRSMFSVTSKPVDPAVSVPAPGTLVLLGLGLAGLAVARRRRQ